LDTESAYQEATAGRDEEVPVRFLAEEGNGWDYIDTSCPGQPKDPDYEYGPD
jgi:hypothetical protein